MNEHPSQLVHIEKPVYGGDFLARSAGKVMFVPHVLPGEDVRVHVVGGKSGYHNAEIDSIETANSGRVEPRCAHFGVCGGCQYQHTNYETQLALKRTVLGEVMERSGVAFEGEIGVLAGEPWGYRNRIRLTFDAQGRFGYRGRRSHSVIPITECPIAAPLLLDAATAFAGTLPVSAQKPAEITLFCDAEESAVVISAEFPRTTKLDVNALGRGLAEQLPQLKGLEFLAAGRGNQLPRVTGQWGETPLTYQAADFAYRVDQGAFFQVNRYLVDRLVQLVMGDREGRLAWDLFAGVGLFARQLTTGFERVVAVESAPASTQALAANLKYTRSAPVRATTLDFLNRNHGDARPDLIVVDPPRSGLGAEVTKAIVEIAPADIVYVSCDPSTLGRDLHVMLQRGYAVRSMTLVDLFPQTFHLETVVQLQRT